MAYAKDTLVDRDGWLYELMEWSHTSKPIITRVWYPIGLRTAQYLRDYEDGWEGQTRIGKPCQRTGSGTFRIDGLEFALVERGQTQAEFMDEIPYPYPKVRKGIETRYHNGSWQKYLKTQGWVDC